MDKEKLINEICEAEYFGGMEEALKVIAPIQAEIDDYREMLNRIANSNEWWEGAEINNLLDINTGGSEMTDQCRHCVNRGNITACQSVQCHHHDDWYPMTLQAEIDDLKRQIKQAKEAARIRLNNLSPKVKELLSKRLIQRGEGSLDEWLTKKIEG